MSTEQIPLIDLTPFRGRDVEGKQRVAAEVARACEEVGFLMVSGHGVDQGLIDDTLSQTWIFFDLPDEEKRHWISPAGDGRRGYLPVGGNTLANTIGQDSPPDLIEAFTCGRFDLPDDPYYTAHRDSWFEPNIWPRHPSGFRDQLCAYYRAMEGLAAELMRIFATALGLPENYFADKIDKHITALRLNHYAAATQDPLPRQLRAGPHTDYGSLTILYPTRNPGGLQVYTSDDTWCDVDPVPGTFVVNIGDLMAQWTNDRWVSTLHRVVNPPHNRLADSRRASIAFFHQPNYDAEITCLETCQGPDRPPRYAPTTSGDHLVMKTTKETGKDLERH